MEIRQLRYFITVAKHLHFTEAAKELFVDQSAVSLQIANLERKLGVKLFLRNKRSVQLTNAGTVFFKEAVEIIERSEEAVEKTRQAEAGLIGSLRIGFLVAPVRNFLPEVIRQFSRKYPKVEIKLYHLPSGHLNDLQKTGDLDIVFTLSHGLQNMDGLDFKTVSYNTTSVFMHCEHPLSRRSKITIGDLVKESFVIREREESPQWYDYTLMICGKKGFSPNIVSTAQRIETVLLFVDAGLGIAVLPKYLQMYASSTLRIMEIEEEKNKVEIVMYRKISNTNPSIPLFLEELDSVLTQQQHLYV